MMMMIININMVIMMTSMVLKIINMVIITIIHIIQKTTMVMMMIMVMMMMVVVELVADLVLSNHQVHPAPVKRRNVKLDNIVLSVPAELLNAYPHVITMV
jgi:hypothetical protein